MQDFGSSRVGDNWDERGRTDLDEVMVYLRLGEVTAADRLAVVLEATRRGRGDVFVPSRKTPPPRRFRNNAGGRVALRLHLAALRPDLGPLPAAPRTTAGLPPLGYRVRSTDNLHGTVKPMRDYESEDDVFVLVVGSSTDDRYQLSGWCHGWDILGDELPRDEVQPMTALPLLDSLRSRRQA
jgi:hypothetical protein